VLAEDRQRALRAPAYGVTALLGRAWQHVGFGAATPLERDRSRIVVELPGLWVDDGMPAQCLESDLAGRGLALECTRRLRRP
jgi:hypothetical protein